MKKRFRQHVNPHDLHHLVSRKPLNLPSGIPVEIELGCGEGHFVIERAAQCADRLVVGLDIRQTFLAEALEQVQRRGLTNVRLEKCNLLVDLPDLVGGCRISRFYVNFPDPCFKRRHRQRRWLTAERIAHLTQTLLPGGEFYVQTDVWEVALSALALLEGAQKMENANTSWTFARENPFAVRSNRELICIRQRRKIWRLLFRRT